MKRVVSIALFALLLAAVVAGTGVYKMNRFMDTPVTLPQEGATFDIAPGSSFKTVAADLVALGIIENDFWYRLYARQSGKAGGIHAGEYILRTRRNAAQHARAVSPRFSSALFVHDY